MVYLSDVLTLPVVDNQGRHIGAVADLVVNTREAFPVVAAVVVTPATARTPLPVKSAPLIIPWRQIISIEEPRLRLNVAREQIHTYSPHPGDVYLGRDVLDKQIVDTHGRRVVKVNDLKLAQVRGAARLLGADIGFWAFFRRLLPFRFTERLVPWNYVQQVEQEPGDVRLRVPQTSLADLHPADLADLLEEMHPEAAAAVLKSLDVETAADALEEVEERYQAPLVEEMPADQASDVLEAMPPDEAADIIGDLPEDKAQEILAGMEPEPAQEVKELLQYDEHTAGGRMTPEVFTLLSTMTADDAIRKLRAEGPPPEKTYYLFVTNGHGELVGVASLRALITSKASTPIADIMRRDVITVYADDDQETVATVIRKYSLLGVPVIDSQRRLLGMVTIDEILDVMQEETSEDISQAVGTASEEIAHTASPRDVIRGRFISLTFSLLGGLAAGWVLTRYDPFVLAHTTLIFYTLPVVIAVGHIMGSQSWAVMDRDGSTGEFWRQSAFAAIEGALFGVILGLIAWLGTGSTGMGVAVGIGLFASLAMAGVLGAALPLALRRLSLQPTVAGGPLVDALNSVISISVYLLLSSALLRLLG
jgi:magnesium transporter